MRCQQFKSSAVSFLLAQKKPSSELTTVASAISPRQTPIMMFRKGCLTLKKFQRSFALWQEKETARMWQRSGAGQQPMVTAHDN